MTIESGGGQSGEVLLAEQFLARSLSILGIDSAVDASPEDKARILTAFQLERCDDDLVRWLPELPEDQREKVHGMLVERGGEMRRMAEILIVGHVSTGEEIEGFEALITD